VQVDPALQLGVGLAETALAGWMAINGKVEDKIDIAIAIREMTFMFSV
jgi:hypothetical protein